MPEALAEGVKINRSLLRIIRDDITELELDAFVFYAEPSLALGSGFGTAISARGGPAIQKELEQVGPVATGEVVVSGAGKLKAEFIIHAVGPRFQEEDTEGKLRTTVGNALRAAEEKGIQRIALPAMGTGFYGIPLDVCARVMIDSIREYLQGETEIQEVVICVIDQRELKPFEAVMAGLSH
jgi:O-acetyl-ADP-ribose deacetylase (regulator of RNase III)